MGNEIFGPGMYWRAPAGLRVPDISVDKGTEVLIFREYGDWGTFLFLNLIKVNSSLKAETLHRKSQAN